jgi:hypothetical protein
MVFYLVKHRDNCTFTLCAKFSTWWFQKLFPVADFVQYEIQKALTEHSLCEGLVLVGFTATYTTNNKHANVR